MEMEQTPRNVSPAYSDEIDLVDLFHKLWQQRLLIIACTLVVAVGAAIFAFLSRSEYEARAGVLPPQLSDVVVYNFGRKEAGLSQFSVSEVYSLFKSNLLSDSLKRTFFRNVYLPSLAADKRNVVKDKLWDEFNRILRVRASSAKNRPNLYEVVVVYESPALAAEWVNLYIDMAAKKTEQNMRENSLSEILTKTQVIEKQIDVLRTTAKKRREDRIARLRDALVVAEAVGLDAPQVVAGRAPSDGDLAQFIDGNLIYMRGAKAIQAELAVLEKRENDDPFIAELRGLENRLDFLKNIDVASENASVFIFDGEAEIPGIPVKPKQVIIIAYGLIFGFILGIIAVLIRSVVKSRNRQIDGG